MTQTNKIHAHIFGRSRRGDREEVDMALFNPDGSPFIPGSGGASSQMVYVGTSQGVIGNFGNTLLPIGNVEIQRDIGFEVIQNENFFDVPSGMYIARTTTTWSGWSPPPDTGVGEFQVVHISDTEEIVLVTNRAGAEYKTTGEGDFGFLPYGGGTKTDMQFLEDGRFELRATHNVGNNEYLNLQVKVAILKL